MNTKLLISKMQHTVTNVECLVMESPQVNSAV